MTTKHAWAGLLSAAVAVSSVAATSAGCKYFKKSSDTEETSSSKPAPPPEPEPTATSTATATATADASDVKTYPNQLPASGTYRLLRSFYVYNEADTNSKKLGGVGEGTIIHLKATLGQWLLIEWPSAPGTMSPGWIQVQLHGNRPDPTVLADATEIVDAGKPVDAGPVPVVDAGAVHRPTLVIKQTKRH